MRMKKLTVEIIRVKKNLIVHFKVLKIWLTLQIIVWSSLRMDNYQRICHFRNQKEYCKLYRFKTKDKKTSLNQSTI